MVKTTVYLDETVARKLKQMASAQGRSQAELIRECVARLTDTQRPVAPGGLGKFRGANTDHSVSYRTRLRGAVRAGQWA